MRRDIGFYIEASIDKVYQAYLSAATNKPFERSCKQEPYHTISFGVNYSFKYNMNGGACTIHFMPYGTGTAVNMRFSIAQLAAARYELYAIDLNNAMQAYLPVVPQQMIYNMDDFLKAENRVTPATFTASVAPQAVTTAPAAGFCTKCGNAMAPDDRFCTKCGTPLSMPTQKACPNCGKVADLGDAFCNACGTRL